MRSILAIAFWLSGAVLFAAETPAPKEKAVTDPTLIEQHYREVTQRPEFYRTEEAGVDTRLRDRLSQWFNHFNPNLSEFKYANEMSSFASALFALLSVLTLFGLIYVIVRLSRRSRDHDEMEPRFTVETATANQPEKYDDQIRASVAAGQWRDAWLTAWRQFLARLENRHLVETDRTQTNREYLAQLQSHPLPESALPVLHGLVDTYDREIYGRRTIDERDWELFRAMVNEAMLLLNLNEKGKRREP